MNLPKNVQGFLTEFGTYVQKTSIEKGKLIITLKTDCYKDPKSYFNFNQLNIALKSKYQIETYIKQVIKSDEIDEFASMCGMAKIVVIELHIDVTALITDRLRAFFSPEMDCQSISDSIAFLASQGWNDVKFQNELGVARTTLYRYKTKNKENSPLQTPVQTETMTQLPKLEA
jgi:hypothetical protein